MVIIIWAPGVQGFFQSSNPPAIGLVPCLVWAVYAWGITECIKFMRRRDRGACKLLTW